MVTNNRFPALIFAMLTVFSFIPASSFAQASQADVTEADEHKVLEAHEAAMAAGDETAAIKHVLEHAEKVRGENAPATAKLTHQYGHLLYKDGDYRHATDVLILALERSAAAFGDGDGEAFELNMKIGYAYSQWNDSLSVRMKYFDRALKILRERGERETLRYITTLINIVSNMMDNGGLRGEYTGSVSGGTGFSFEREYRNYFHKAEKYILEAVELAENMDGVDEYLSAKIAIAQARLQVNETADLGRVPVGVFGYISEGTMRKRNDREEDRLETAITKLAEDIEKNERYLGAARKMLMEIAWLNKDAGRMAAMCAEGALNSSVDYPKYRLYDVMEDGTVIATDFSFSISTNIFRPVPPRGGESEDADEKRIRPYFIPVCVDGRLKAALVNAPRVTIEDFVE